MDVGRAVPVVLEEGDAVPDAFELRAEEEAGPVGVSDRVAISILASNSRRDVDGGLDPLACQRLGIGSGRWPSSKASGRSTSFSRR